MSKANSFFNLDMLVLSILKIEDCYGYEIVKKINDISDGVISIKEGTLYPILYTLLKKNFITSSDVLVNRKVRVYYHLEQSGLDYLNDIQAHFKINMQGILKILDFCEKGG